MGDSLIGVRDCGCITAWLSVEHSTKKDMREFYRDMADTGREVRKANLADIRDRIWDCRHSPSMAALPSFPPPDPRPGEAADATLMPPQASAVARDETGPK